MEEQDLGNGIKIIGFDSFEEMLAYSERKKAEAIEQMKHLTESQRGIGWGSYVVRLEPIEDGTLVIFGYIYTEEEYQAREIEAGAPEDELEYTMARLHAIYEQGFRYGYWYSEKFPEGESGDTHITSLWPITEADYQHALNNGWKLPRYLQTRITDEMAEQT